MPRTGCLDARFTLILQWLFWMGALFGQITSGTDKTRQEVLNFSTRALSGDRAHGNLTGANGLGECCSDRDEPHEAAKTDDWN